MVGAPLRRVALCVDAAEGGEYVRDLRARVPGAAGFRPVRGPPMPSQRAAALPATAKEEIDVIRERVKPLSSAYNFESNS